MAMTKRERAAIFSDMMGHFRVRMESPDCSGGIARNDWLKQHPDLGAEYLIFMRAFVAELQQRYEEE